MPKGMILAVRQASFKHIFDVMTSILWKCSARLSRLLPCIVGPSWSNVQTPVPEDTSARDICHVFWIIS